MGFLSVLKTIWCGYQQSESAAPPPIEAADSGSDAQSLIRRFGITLVELDSKLGKAEFDLRSAESAVALTAYGDCPDYGAASHRLGVTIESIRALVDQLKQAGQQLSALHPVADPSATVRELTAPAPDVGRWTALIINATNDPASADVFCLPVTYDLRNVARSLADLRAQVTTLRQSLDV